MDFLSLLPAVTILVLVPVGLGLAINALAGNPADDAFPTLLAPIVNPDGARSGPIVPEVDYVPWRFDLPQAGGAAPTLARSRTMVGRPALLPN
jgi:hypothetical protein